MSSLVPLTAHPTPTTASNPSSLNHQARLAQPTHGDDNTLSKLATYPLTAHVDACKQLISLLYPMDHDMRPKALSTANKLCNKKLGGEGRWEEKTISFLCAELVLILH